MITALDSNVLIDILLPGSEFLTRSKAALDKAANESELVICEVVFAELAGQFASDGLSRFFEHTGVRLVSSGRESLHAAGNAWIKYLSTRPAGVVCATCCRRLRLACEHCGSPVRSRQHLVADFLIGAHAWVHADRLLTRDRGYYRTYFPGLTVIDPSE